MTKRLIKLALIAEALSKWLKWHLFSRLQYVGKQRGTNMFIIVHIKFYSELFMHE